MRLEQKLFIIGIVHFFHGSYLRVITLYDANLNGNFCHKLAIIAINVRLCQFNIMQKQWKWCAVLHVVRIRNHFIQNTNKRARQIECV